MGKKERGEIFISISFNLSRALGKKEKKIFGRRNRAASRGEE